MWCCYVRAQGDMAVCGIQKFFETHRCNEICRMLGLASLPTNVPNTRSKYNLSGTPHSPLPPPTHHPQRSNKNLHPPAETTTVPSIGRGVASLAAPPPSLSAL